MQDFDSVIRGVYSILGIPADRLLSESGAWDEFVRLIAAQHPMQSNLDEDLIKHRILALRKKGADKGGLPRLKRAYHGRFRDSKNTTDVKTGA